MYLTVRIYTSFAVTQNKIVMVLFYVQLLEQDMEIEISIEGFYIISIVTKSSIATYVNLT